MRKLDFISQGRLALRVVRVVVGRADDADVAGAEDEAAAAAQETPAGARRRGDALRPPDGPLDVGARLRGEPARDLELVVAGGGGAGRAERQED